MKKITTDWLEKYTVLLRSDNSFYRTFHVNGIKTQIRYIINVKGYSMVYLFQGENLENKILIGCIRTFDEAVQMYKLITGGEELIKQRVE